MGFSISDYEYDKKHCSLEIGGELMTYHCHHYLVNLQRTVYDAEYIDGTALFVGCAADAVYNQLSNLCEGKSEREAKELIEQMYKTFGNGLIDISSMNECGAKIVTTKSIVSKAWLMLFKESKKPVDAFTAGYLAAAYAVLYGKELKDVYVEQTCEMAQGADANEFIVKNAKANFNLYPKKREITYHDVDEIYSTWEHSETITEMFAGAHKNFVGNEEGFIAAFGVYVINNQNDYANRVEFEFMKEVKKFAGDYGFTLASELLMEAGIACGFFTLGGILTSPEWEKAVKPFLKEPEDWIHAIIALTNNMGWGHQVATEVSKEKFVFRNYNDLEDISYKRMYESKSEYFTHWANSGGMSALMPLIYNSELIEKGKIDYIEMYNEIRRSKYGYRTKRTKGITVGDDYLEMEVILKDKH